MLERFDLFMNNYQNMYYNRPLYNTGDRQFLFPFLTGALVGGAAIGLTRPRPIINADMDQDLCHHIIVQVRLILTIHMEVIYQDLMVIKN